MDGLERIEVAPILKTATSPAWFPTVIGGSAWWQPDKVHQRAAVADRRLSTRCVPTGAAIALLRPAGAPLPAIDRMNMGGIGMAVLKANPSKIGRIKDISSTGLAFYYVDAAERSVQPSRLDILLAEKGFYLKDIDFSVVSDIRRIDDSDFDSNQIGQLAVSFQRLTPHQKRHLDRFIASFTERIS